MGVEIRVRNVSTTGTHNRALVMDSMGDTAFTLFSTALPQWQTTHPAK